MAEAFCDKHMMTWYENGETFTDWRTEHENLLADLEWMRREGIVRLSHEDPMVSIIVFRDRSWIAENDSSWGGAPDVGTGEDWHRVLDLIQEALNQEAYALAEAGAILEEQPKEQPENDTQQP